MIEITEEDIAYAEKILLPVDKCFDKERRDFICNLNTIDLQAVPGSGKTTALLAKLLILERYLPLDNGRGILIISHTNAAVDEISERIGRYCPHLFSYPNFVGTIQNFVDKFLAIPYYTSYFGNKPYRIDNEIYDEKIDCYYENMNNVGLKAYLDRQHDGLNFFKSIRFNDNYKLIQYLSGTISTFKLKNENSKTYKALRKFKMRLLKNGYLHYDDGYTLAQIALKTFPQYPKIIQQRFKFVFVDEMQDMEKYQYELLEKLFNTEASITKLQRIGDVNQAIYSGYVSTDEIWDQREDRLYLNGSHRLNERIASIVQNLAIHPNKLIGLNDYNGRKIDIKPLIIKYDLDAIDKVIPNYALQIKELEDNGSIPTDCKRKYTAIGWRKENEEERKICIADYWDGYSKTTISKKIDFISFADYFYHYDKDKKTMEAARKSILSGILKILRFENIEDQYDRPYTISRLINFLQKLPEEEYQLFKTNLFEWCFNCIKGSPLDALIASRMYLARFLNYFDKEINYSADFINNDAQSVSLSDSANEIDKYFSLNDININVSTIHSIKGQTHTATLYLETFFSRGQGHYESERLFNQLLDTPFVETLGKAKSSIEILTQSAKMAYVGFSRPTHFLALAIESSRFDKNLKEIDRNIWDVIEIKKNDEAVDS